MAAGGGGWSGPPLLEGGGSDHPRVKNFLVQSSIKILGVLEETQKSRAYARSFEKSVTTDPKLFVFSVAERPEFFGALGCSWGQSTGKKKDFGALEGGHGRAALVSS